MLDFILSGHSLHSIQLEDAAAAFCQKEGTSAASFRTEALLC